MGDEFRVRYSYTPKTENLSQNVQKEYDKLSAIDHIVLWYIANYTLEELQNVIKIPGMNITRESDGMKITFENPEIENSTNILFTVVTDMLMEFAQDYSYTELPVRLRSTILSVVQSDPPDALKSGLVVLVSDKKFGLVGNKDMLDDTRKALIQRAESLQIWKETVDIQPAHEELIEKLSIIETLHQKHQVQIGLQRILNVSGTKGNVEKCVAEYNSIVSGIKPEGQNIPQTWVDLLNNKEVQDYIREELRRENIRCVWRVDKQGRKVLVYSLDSKTSREACRIIYESISDGKYPKEICTQQEVQDLIKRQESLLNICESDETLYIVGVRTFMDSIDDIVKHQGNMQTTHQQPGIRWGGGYSQVQNMTGKYQQNKTLKTGVGQSQVQNVTGKYQHDKTGYTDGDGQSQVQNVTGHNRQGNVGNKDVVGQRTVQNVKGKYQQGKTGNTDVVNTQVQRKTRKYQQDKTGNTNGRGQCQEQNEAGKYQQNNTGYTSGGGHSQVQDLTKKYQQDKIGNTVGRRRVQVQNVTGKYQQDKTGSSRARGRIRVQNVTRNYPQDKVGKAVGRGHSHVQNVTGKYQQDKTGTTSARGRIQVQNVTGKYQQEKIAKAVGRGHSQVHNQQDKTGNTYVVGHSQVQSVTGKNQQDKTGNTYVVGHTQVQSVTGKNQQDKTGNTDVGHSQSQDVTSKYQLDKTGNTDVVGHIKVQNGTGKCQQYKTENTDVVGHSQVQNGTGVCQQDETENTDVVGHSQVQNGTGKCQQDETGNTDVVGHSQVQNGTGKYQQDKTENTDVVGHSQVQNVTGKYQHDKTGNTDVVGHSQVQNGTGKCQQDKTGNTDVVGHSQVQNGTGKYQQDKTGNTDVVGHSQVQNVTEKYQQDKTGNTDVVGHSQVQNVTEKCQHDKTGNTDVVGHSQVQNVTEKYQQDKTGNTDVVGHSQVQNGTGKYQQDKTGNTDVVGHSQIQNVTEKYQQDKTGNTDVVGHSQVQNGTGKYQQDKTGNTDVAGHSQVQNGTGKYQQDKTGNTDVVKHIKVQNGTGKYQQDKTGNTDVVGHSQVQNGTGKYQHDKTGNTDVVGHSQMQNGTGKCQHDKTGNTDVVGHSQVQNGTGKCQHDKTENTDVVGHSQVQNGTGKYQHDKTGNTDVVGHSQIQNGTGKCQHDKTGNTDVVGHSQVQNVSGKYQQDKTGSTDGGGHSQVQNETGKYQQDKTGSTDDVGHSLCKNVTGKNQQDERENTDVVGYCMAQAPCDDADFIEEVIKGIVNTPCNDDDLQTGHIAQTLGTPTVGEQFSVDQQTSATNQKSKVCKPVGEVTEVRLHIDNDRLMYIQEHQREVLNNISESHGVSVRLENNDEFVIAGGMESTYKAQKDLKAICKGVMCCSAEVETADLYRPEVTTKLGDLERKERCIIEFPGVHPKRLRCLHSWVYLDDQMTITITCGPVENASADVIVLPVNAMGDIIGDSDDVRQAHFDQSQTKSQFAKENILFLPNSSTLNCLTIAFAYVPEWTNESQVDDEELKKFEKLLKHVIERGVRSVVIPVDITEGFPFSTFGCELVVKLLCQQSHLKYRLEVFLCTKTLYNGLLLKSKLQRSHYLMEQGDRITEVLFGTEHQLEISRGLYLEKVIQIHVKNESMISMQSKVFGQPVFDRCMSGTNGYAKVMVDVIVNSVERNLDLTEGCFSTAILEAGGSAIQDECTRIYPDGICYGDVAVTGPGRLQCKILCHGAILGKWIPSGNFSIRVLKSVLRKCLLETEKRQYKTIAMPAVGTGTLGYPYHRVAEAMFDVVEEYQRDHQKTCITDVFFVIHQDDKKVLEAFKFQEERNRKRPMKLHTAARDDQPVEYIESFVSDLQLRFQTLQLANVLHMVDKPEAVVTFDFHRSTDSVIHEWNKDGNYIDIVAHHDGTDDTFKSVVDAILNITQENMITSVAFHVHLNSFVTRSPVALAEYVREIVYRRTFPRLSMSTKFVYHYIRLIQFVVNNNTDIRDYIPTGFTGYMKKLFSYPLKWQFVSYAMRSNNVCKVLAEDGAIVKRVQDEVRRLVTQQLDQEQDVRKGISSSRAED